MIDPQAIQGKIKALQSSFELLAEITNSPSTASKVGLYTDYFVQQGLAMHDVNIAVEQMMVDWSNGYWPSPEKIAARAREIHRRASVGNPVGRARWEEIEEACAQEDARKWENRVEMANRWRVGNPDHFTLLCKDVEGQIKHLIEVVRLEWMTESRTYRDNFRDGATVGGCLRLAGIDERKLEKRLEAERQVRAKRFGATGEVPA